MGLIKSIMDAPKHASDLYHIFIVLQHIPTYAHKSQNGTLVYLIKAL